MTNLGVSKLRLTTLPFSFSSPLILLRINGIGQEEEGDREHRVESLGPLLLHETHSNPVTLRDSQVQHFQPQVAPAGQQPVQKERLPGWRVFLFTGLQHPGSTLVSKSVIPFAKFLPYLIDPSHKTSISLILSIKVTILFAIGLFLVSTVHPHFPFPGTPQT